MYTKYIIEGSAKVGEGKIISKHLGQVSLQGNGCVVAVGNKVNKQGIKNEQKWEEKKEKGKKGRKSGAK